MAEHQYIQNEPVPYMDLQTLWSDRREPHANPLCTGNQGRREKPRANTSGLGKAVEGLFHPGPFDTEAHYPLADKRLYGDQK